MVIDSNNDGATWVWRNDDNPYARCNSGDNGKDDWLLTPLLHLEGNRSYVLSFKYYNGYYPAWPSDWATILRPIRLL